jgi:hypothetical protein
MSAAPGQSHQDTCPHRSRVGVGPGCGSGVFVTASSGESSPADEAEGHCYIVPSLGMPEDDRDALWLGGPGRAGVVRWTARAYRERIRYVPLPVRQASARRWIVVLSQPWSSAGSPSSERAIRRRVETPSTKASIAAARLRAVAPPRPLETQLPFPITHLTQSRHGQRHSGTLFPFPLLVNARAHPTPAKIPRQAPVVLAIDEPAAVVVERIFAEFLAGLRVLRHRRATDPALASRARQLMTRPASGAAAA